MSPRDLSNQVLKNLQGQFPTVLGQPVPGLDHSHCAFFFFLKSNCNFPSANCDCGFFPFTVHPCKIFVSAFSVTLFEARGCCKQISPQPSGWSNPVSSAFPCMSITPALPKSQLPSSGLSPVCKYLFCIRKPKTGLWTWLYKGWAVGDNHFPWAAGHALVSAAQSAVSLRHCKELGWLVFNMLSTRIPRSAFANWPF